MDRELMIARSRELIKEPHGGYEVITVDGTHLLRLSDNIRRALELIIAGNGGVIPMSTPIDKPVVEVMLKLGFIELVECLQEALVVTVEMQELSDEIKGDYNGKYR